MRRSRAWLVAVVLTAAVRPCRADGEYAAAKTKATNVVAAGSGAKAKELANEAGPDPWLVVDALLEAGRSDLAKDFAAGTPDSVRAALEEYAARPPKDP